MSTSVLTCSALPSELSKILNKCDGSPFDTASDKIVSCTDNAAVTSLFTPGLLTQAQIDALCAIIKKCLEEPSMLVTKVATAFPNPAAAGQQITYSISVQNTGNVPLANVVISDPNAVVSGSPVALIPIGGTATVTATRTITAADLAAGSADNQATATGTTPSGTTVSQPSQPVPGEEPAVTSVPLTPAVPAMTVTKLATTIPDPAAVGQKITYTITVVNTGNVPLTNVVVTDSNAAIVSGSPIANLPVGGSATATAEHTLTADDITARQVVNRASASGNSIAGPLTVSSNTVVTPICVIVSRTAGAWSAVTPTQWQETTGVIASWTTTAPATVGSPAASVIDPANSAAWYTGIAPGAPALSAVWNWDSAPEGPLTDIDLATDDKGRGTLRITFPAGTTRKVIHIDRMGGFGSVTSSGVVTTRSNSSAFTMTTPGSLTKLSGTDDFIVSGTTIKKLEDIAITGTTSPVTGMGNAMTAGGSVLVNTASNVVDFSWTGVGVEGGGGDGFRLTVNYDIRVCGP